MDIWVWPIVVVIISISSFIIFRTPISGFISRVREINKTGVKAMAGDSQNPPATDSSQMDELMRSFDNILLKKQEDAIEEELSNKQINTDPDKVKVLIRHLAAYQQYFQFEKIYSEIYGSQINMLQGLNSSFDGNKDENLKSHYDFNKTLYPEFFKEYPFEKYINYLIQSGLVTENSGIYKITQFGTNFLIYLTQTGKNTYKMY